MKREAADLKLLVSGSRLCRKEGAKSQSLGGGGVV